VTFGNGIFNNSGVTNLSNNVTIGNSATFTVGSNATAAVFSGNLTVSGIITSKLNGYALNASNANSAGSVSGPNVSGNISGTAANASNVIGTGTITTTTITATTWITTPTITCTNLTASNDVVVSSDRRLKTNILTIENSLSTVNGMRGVFYTLLSEPTLRKVGVIAQEMEQALPEVVSTDKTEEKIKGVAYGNISAVLIEAVKELTQRMERVELALNLIS
jgi:hypothetical protein